MEIGDVDAVLRGADVAAGPEEKGLPLPEITHGLMVFLKFLHQRADGHEHFPLPEDIAEASQQPYLVAIDSVGIGETAAHPQKIPPHERESKMVVGIGGGVAELHGALRQDMSRIGILLKKHPGAPVAGACRLLPRSSPRRLDRVTPHHIEKIAPRDIHEYGPLHHLGIAVGLPADVAPHSHGFSGGACGDPGQK